MLSWATCPGLGSASVAASSSRELSCFLTRLLSCLLSSRLCLHPWQAQPSACRQAPPRLALPCTLLPLPHVSVPFAGLYNILTGLAFGLPMPVQPMKTIAAVALSQAALTVPQARLRGRNRAPRWVVPICKLCEQLRAGPASLAIIRPYAVLRPQPCLSSPPCAADHGGWHLCRCLRACAGSDRQLLVGEQVRAGHAVLLPPAHAGVQVALLACPWPTPGAWLSSFPALLLPRHCFRASSTLGPQCIHAWLALGRGLC